MQIFAFLRCASVKSIRQLSFLAGRNIIRGIIIKYSTSREIVVETIVSDLPRNYYFLRSTSKILLDDYVRFSHDSDITTPFNR